MSHSQLTFFLKKWIKLTFSISFLLVSASAFAQTNCKPLKEFLFEVEKQYDISIIYKSDLVEGICIPKNTKIYGDAENLLKKVLSPHQLVIKKIQERGYVIIKEEIEIIPPKEEKPVLGAVYGRVLDELGEPMFGVNVYLAGTSIGTSTDMNGEYRIDNIKAKKYIARASFLGYIEKDTTFEISRWRKNHRLNFILKSDLLSLKTVVITGVNEPVINLESGLAITSIFQDDLDKMSPRSTADALQSIPGFMVESSAGEVSNNLFSRGMPSEGYYQYVALHEDGLPIYEAGNLEWVAADHFIRLDGTYKQIEAMRGGSAGVFTGNAPGGIINFISKTGGSKHQGSFKSQVADFGQMRLEGEVGGPLDKTVRYHIGGFYRVDNGVRKTGFLANRGGQIKGNITKVYNNGFVRVSAKYLNDRNVYYAAIPLKNTREPEAIYNFDANYGTLTSNHVRYVTLPNPFGENDFDLADGMHTHLGYIGSRFKFDFGDGWSIFNKNRFSIIDKGSNAIVALFTPKTTTQFLQQNYGYTPQEDIVLATQLSNGAAFNILNSNQNGLVVETNWWANNHFMRNFINNLEINKKGEKFQVSGNLYVSVFSNQTKRDWGDLLLEVKSDQPSAIDVAFLNMDSTVTQRFTHNGFTSYQGLDTYLYGEGIAWLGASFIHGKYYFTPELSLDGGVRYEALITNGVIENTQIYNLNPELVENEVLAAVRYGDSTFTRFHVFKHDYSWTLGFNHLITPSASWYVRASEGFRMPDFDNWYNKQIDGGEIERVFQTEIGYKYASDEKYAFLFTGFYSYISNQVTTEASIDDEGNLIPPRTRDALSYGGEFESINELYKGLSLNIIATLQKATYIVDQDQELEDYEINGNDVKRIPNFYLLVQPTYEYKSIKIFGTAQYVSKRFGDEINIDVLPAYTSYNVGISYKYKSYSILIHAQNVTNVVGLTEGNSRVIADTSDRALRMARPILGRSVIAYVAYQF